MTHAKHEEEWEAQLKIGDQDIRKTLNVAKLREVIRRNFNPKSESITKSKVREVIERCRVYASDSSVDPNEQIIRVPDIKQALLGE